VTVTTTTNKNSSGTVTGSKEVSVIESAAKNTSVTVTVEKSAAGKVTSAKAVVTKTGTTSGSSTKVSIPATVVSQIQEAAGQDSVDVTVKVVNAAGTLKYNLKVNAKNLAAGKTLYAYALNTKTGEYTAVNSTKYTVTSSGSLAVTLSKKATYELVTAKSASAISKNILATVKAAKSSVTLKKGKTTTFGLSSKLNQSNVKSISYTTSKKTVATVSKAGKITAKKAGTATIKAKVTLKNGKTKTVSTKVTVK
jgi:endo-1,4-beta-xylanase